MISRIKIGALVSGGGTNLQAIIDACEAGRLPADIVFVGADNPEAKGLERAARHGIPSFVVDYREIVRRVRDDPDSVVLPDDFDLEKIRTRQKVFLDEDPEIIRRYLSGRAIAEKRLIEAMAPYSIDLLILAGFMRNLTPYFIDRFSPLPDKPRIMNIHPALLPAFPGVDGYGDTFRYGCKVGGCTVHFVDYGEDSGPIIGQRAFTIQPGDSIENVRGKGLELEWELYPECIRLFAERRLTVVKQKHTLPGGRIFERRVVEIQK
jgi:phosphoribosylglycinamide formyltransferase 1